MGAFYNYDDDQETTIETGREIEGWIIQTQVILRRIYLNKIYNHIKVMKLLSY